MTNTHEHCVALDLDREAAWVAHAAVLSRIERAVDDDETPFRALGVLESIEGGDPCLTDDELGLLEAALESHRENAPERDRRALEGALDRLERTRTRHV